MRITQDSTDGDQLLDVFQAQKHITARDRLIAHYIPLVYKVCRKFRDSGGPLEDLVQVGSIGLLKAVKRYDPDRGSNFKAFANSVIVREIKNYFRDHGWAVKVPRKIQKQTWQVQMPVGHLRQSLGRRPTIQEIMEATGLSKEEVFDTFDFVKCAKLLSLEVDYETSTGKEGTALVNLVGSEDPELERLTDKIDLAKSLSCLDSREKTIVSLHFYRGLSQTKIAEQLGVSQVHVSRLQRSALNKFRIVLTQDLGRKAVPNRADGD